MWLFGRAIEGCGCDTGWSFVGDAIKTMQRQKDEERSTPPKDTSAMINLFNAAKNYISSRRVEVMVITCSITVNQPSRSATRA